MKPDDADGAHAAEIAGAQQIGASDVPQDDVLRLASIDMATASALLQRHGLVLETVGEGIAIPGSYWGESEAGVIANRVYARADTPVHSLLHEACHLIVAPREHRERIHTNASNSQAEEDAACYLQIVLGDALPGVGSARLCADMDRWGYTFRLGSARAWFEHDAEDARAWLIARRLLDDELKPGIPSAT